MSRQSITVSADAFERFKEHKRDGESWTDLVERAADRLDGQEPTHASGECGLNSVDGEVLTTEHIPDIVNEASRATADELESRFR